MEEINLKQFRCVLAENKVYDAWSYVESLSEILSYMEVTYQGICKVRENTLSQIEKVNMKKHEDLENGKTVYLTSEDFRKTDIDICGLELSEAIYLRKSIIEFFHYARIGMDRLFLVINSSLLGESAIQPYKKGFIKKMLSKLDQKDEFKEISKELGAINDHDVYTYLRRFDNYTKHMNNVLVTINNPFFLCTNSQFTLGGFSGEERINGVNIKYSYNQINANDQMEKVRKYINETINDILIKVQEKIPNCTGNKNRIQKLRFKMQCKEMEDGKLVTDYVSYFIEVDNGLQDIPREIKLCPIMILPNNEVECFDFNFDKIFICKKGTESVIGCAELKEDSKDRVYKTYEVKQCQMIDYIKYIDEFKENYTACSINGAMEGSIVTYKCPPTK